MLRDLRGWPTPAPILAAAAALDFGVVTYMIVRRLHPPPPGSRAPPQVTRRMAAAVLEDAASSYGAHDGLASTVKLSSCQRSEHEKARRSPKDMIMSNACLN